MKSFARLAQVNPGFAALGVIVMKTGGELAALLLARWATRLLFGIGAADPATLCQTVGTLLGAALLACLVPARRAAMVDPADSGPGGYPVSPVVIVGGVTK